jgi:hypothetical protein
VNRRSVQNPQAASWKIIPHPASDNGILPRSGGSIRIAAVNLRNWQWSFNLEDFSRQVGDICWKTYNINWRGFA